MYVHCLIIVSGTVVEVTPLAAEKSDIKLGDHVMALVGGGGYAGTYINALTIVLFSSLM